MQTRLIILDPLWKELCNAGHVRKLKQFNISQLELTDLSAESIRKINSVNYDKNILFLNPDVFNWDLDAKVINKIKNCQTVITGSTSYSWIKNAHLLTSQLLNITNFSTDAVTDWLLMVILSLQRRVPLMIKNGFPLNYTTDFARYRGSNMKHKKVGILGLGNMGISIADKCNALGMDVSYWSKSPKSNKYQSKSIKKIFAESDIVIPFFASNPNTAKIITDKLINSMSKQSILVSMIHHDYNHDLLLQKVARGELAGYGFEDETPSSFMKYDGNVWAAPAYGWCTDETLECLMDKSVELICTLA